MVRSVLTILFILLLSFSQAPAQILGFQLENGKHRVQIPIETYNNLIVVPIILNGRLPLKFVIDTGVRTAILTEKAFTDILGLPYSRKYSISVPGRIKSVDAYVTSNVSLEMPGVKGNGHALLVLDEDYLELRNYLGNDVHGILGYELFSRFIVETDYAHKTLTLTLPKYYKPRRRFHRLEMNIEDTKPFIRASVVQQDQSRINAKLLVDSGASHGIILTPFTESDITIPHKNVSSVIGRGLGGEITGKIGRINSITIADFELKDVIAYYPDPNSYFDSLRSLDIFRNGSIGGEILSRFDVVYDFPGEHLYLKKSPAFKRKFFYNLSGLTVKAIGSTLSTFEVVDVREGSAAEIAGVKIGDDILTLNGVEAQHYHLSSIVSLLNSRPGKRITMTLRRDKEQFRVKFKLRNEI